MNISENYDFVIAGINVSGLLMAYRIQMRQPNAKVLLIDKRNENVIYNMADTIPFYLNRIIKIDKLNIRTVKLQTSIWHDNKEKFYINQQMIDDYAEKIVGQKCPNTLSTYIKEKYVYVIQDNGRQKQLLEFLKGQIRSKQIKFVYGEEIKIVNIKNKYVVTNQKIYKYSSLISTIPLNELCNMININMKKDLKCKAVPFFIRGYTSLSNKYYVCYCVDSSIRFYRIAMLNNMIYIESNKDYEYNDLNTNEKELLFKFGINKENFYDYKFKYNMNPGRIVENDSDSTIIIKRELKAYGIFLLGRYAEWRYRLTEDIWEESERIMEQLDETHCCRE